MRNERSFRISMDNKGLRLKEARSNDNSQTDVV